MRAKSVATMVAFGVLLATLPVSGGCDSPGAVSPAKAQTPPAKAGAPQSAPSKAAAPARLVFVDQAKCCACTKARIDTSWAALQKVLADKPLPVQRLHSDEQEAEVKPLRALKPFVALPALYVLDGDGKLVTLLQGELDDGAIRKALGPVPAAK